MGEGFFPAWAWPSLLTSCAVNRDLKMSVYVVGGRGRGRGPAAVNHIIVEIFFQKILNPDNGAFI